MIQQDRIIDIRKHVYENKFSINDYPLKDIPGNMYYSYTNEGDNEENVIGGDMKEYLQMVLDEVKMKNSNKNKND